VIASFTAEGGCQTGDCIVYSRGRGVKGVIASFTAERGGVPSADCIAYSSGGGPRGDMHCLQQRGFKVHR
jgi:hypothetical protein